MLSPGPKSPLVRVALVVLSICCVGGLIGFGAEEVSFRRAAVGDQDAFAAPTGGEPQHGPTAQEQAIVRRATEGLPPYRDAVPEALAADYLGPKAPIAAAWFRTQDSAEQVLRYYQATFTDAGIPSVGERTGPSSGWVGYLNPRTHQLHLITAISEGNQTLVFPSVGNVEALNGGTSTFPDGVPHPEGAQTPLVLTFHREGRTEVSVAARVGTLTLHEVVAFYRRAFPAQGWSLDAVREEKDEATLEASRGATKVTTLLKRRSPNEVELYVRLVGPA